MPNLILVFYIFQIYRATHRLLLLGAGESGKSTLVKQMRILHEDTPFSEEEKKQKIEEIKRNIKDSMFTILSAMATVTPPCTVEKPENAEKRQWLLDNYSNPDFEYTDQFYDYVTELWKDRGVIECFERSNEYQLIDCAKYFLDKVNKVTMGDYIVNYISYVLLHYTVNNILIACDETDV